MDKWDIFVAFSRDNKLDVKATYTLIYVGAFDALFGITNESYSEKLKIYRKAEKEIKEATGSEACLPTKTKTQAIGLADVRNSFDLIKWRQIVNPVSRNQIINLYETSLNENGFKYEPTNPDFKFLKKILMSDNPKRYKRSMVIDNMSRFWARNGDGATMSRLRDSNSYTLFYFLLVNDIKEFPFKNGTKTAIKLSGTTGEEMVSELVIWPEYGGDKPPKFVHKLSKGNAYIFQMSIYLARTGEYKYNFTDVKLLTEKSYGKKEEKEAI